MLAMNSFSSCLYLFRSLSESKFTYGFKYNIKPDFKINAVSVEM